MDAVGKLFVGFAAEVSSRKVFMLCSFNGERDRQGLTSSSFVFLDFRQAFVCGND